jgi:hypothetical protein
MTNFKKLYGVTMHLVLDFILPGIFGEDYKL